MLHQSAGYAPAAIHRRHGHRDDLRLIGHQGYAPVAQQISVRPHSAEIVIGRRIRKAGQGFGGDFLPEAFPLSQFQAVYETLCGTSLAPANFRRMVMPLLDETEEYAVRAGHRPARLYKRKEPSI